MTQDISDPNTLTKPSENIAPPRQLRHSSYWALRTRSTRRMHRVERIADCVFILAMILMVFICGFITYAIARV